MLSRTTVERNVQHVNFTLSLENKSLVCTLAMSTGIATIKRRKTECTRNLTACAHDAMRTDLDVVIVSDVAQRLPVDPVGDERAAVVVDEDVALASQRDELGTLEVGVGRI